MTCRPLGFAALLAVALSGASCRAPMPRGAAEKPTAAVPGETPRASPRPPMGFSRLAMSLDDAPSGRSGHVSLVIDGKLLVIGGENHSRHLDDGGIYDPASDRWQTLRLPRQVGGRFAAAGATGSVRGRSVAFVWGGSEYVEVTSQKGERLADGAAYFPGTGEWQVIEPGSEGSVAGGPGWAPSPRSGHCTAFGSSRLIVWGGENNGIALGDGGLYDPLEKTWTEIPPSGAPLSPGQPGFAGPAARQGMSCFWDEASGRLILYGGFAGAAYGDLWTFDPTELVWEELPPVAGQPTLPRLAPTVGFGGGTLMVYGGTLGAQQQSGELVSTLPRTPQGTAAQAEGGPYVTLNDDGMAPFDGGGFYLAGEDTGRSRTAAYRLAVETSGEAVVSSRWELLSPRPEASGSGGGEDAQSGEDAPGDASSVGLTVKTLGGGRVVFWGGKDKGGQLNSRGVIFTPKEAP